jgi:SpoVK/Ycf46/Vps4 family AAA+-type ATPase
MSAMYSRSDKIPLYTPAQREPERPQLYGCGDPDCTMCNPSIANERARTGQTGRPIPGAPPSGAWSSGDFRPTPRMSEARESIKKFIITAPDQDFDDIKGNEDALASLRDAIEAPAKYADLYRAYGMSMPKGALLSGPPGCGKTMFARAAASEMRRLYGLKEFISISGGELQTMFVGATEALIKDLFTYAREYQHSNGHPLLIFIDEAEVLLPDRTGRVRRVAPWEESQVATFLAEMDGMQASGAFVLLATNRPEVIDSAVLRDGRCDFKVVVRRPTAEAVEHIVRTSLEKCLLKDNLEDLVFAAVESIYDPHKIIVDAERLTFELSKEGWSVKRGDHAHFRLEHIISGAIAAGIGRRATLSAFARDKAEGTAHGITTSDVIAAVNTVFEENKGLTHEYAWTEFVDALEKERKEKADD